MMNKKTDCRTKALWTVCALLVCAAALAVPARADTNKDLYYQQPGASSATSGDSGQTSATKPTIRYWVERAGTRDMIVDTKNSYRSGDKVYFKFGTNVDCHAYLVCKGSSGKVAMMFPGIAGKDNQVKPNSITAIPTINQPFVFDQTPGIEKLCLVVSPKPIEQWEKLSNQARDLSSPLDLNDSQMDLWDEVVSKCANLKATKDLTLEQYENDQDNQGGNYVTDHGESGFTRPIAVYMDLEHKP